MDRRRFLGVVGAGAAGVAGCTFDDLDGERAGDDDDGGGETPDPTADLIDDSPRDLVISLDQLGAGWKAEEYDEERNRQGFRHWQSGQSMNSFAEVFDSIQAAEDDFEAMIDFLEEERIGYDEVDIGDEAILYVHGDPNCLFYERNAFGAIRFFDGWNGHAIEYAELQHENYI